MIGTTVQALEVQRMTLTTLKTMNVQVADLAEAFKLKEPAPAPAPEPMAAPAAAAATGPGVVDPMQWWGALTQQFTQLAAQALNERPAHNSAGTAPKPAATGRSGTHDAPRKTARKMARKMASKTARTSQGGQPAGGRAARRKA
jgi:hypothetical protein